MEELAWHVDGTRVYAKLTRPKGTPCGAVLLVHGFNSCLLEFGDLPHALADAGFATLAIDLRGHGLSAGTRGLMSLERACADIDAATDQLASLAPHAPLAIIGHSLGAALALGHSARGSRFRCLVLAHPVDRLMDELDPLSRLAYHALGRRGQRRIRRGKTPGDLRRPPRYNHLLRDPTAAKRARATAFLQPTIHIGTYPLANTMHASAWAARVKQPVLAIHSPHDRTVRPAHSQAVFAALAGPVQHLSHEGAHSCWLDLDRDVVAAGVVRFLRAQLEGA